MKQLSIEQIDPEIAAIIEHERRRQKEGLEMIASENYASRRRACKPSARC